MKKIIWISSYPKSGNTFLRAMLSAFFYSKDGIFKQDYLKNIAEFPRDFFDLKPFAGIELTSDQASYFLAGVYLDDNAGVLFTGESSRYTVTPSFGAGFYDDGDGKKLGNSIEFRTTLEISYALENENRIGISFGHISNANIGDKNPGVEILNISYQIPYN